ncbi:DNA-binding protein [Carnobacterium divergens]|uniref:DNA-binding protein n=1 Tax=Carnobacterium divergens TaxID=2748 RepID=UPI00289145C9|nr:DNA-binding protein [Carnobacterium divergens]MDT2010836.1 DNA-binding protein [Carnobacterium divergens]
MLHLSDEIIKQQLIGQLNEYVMTQQETCEYLEIRNTHLAKLSRDKKLEPFHVLLNGKMNLNLYFKSDVDRYKSDLEGIRNNRKK